MIQEEARTKMRTILAKVDDICGRLSEEESLDLLDDMVNQLLETRARVYESHSQEKPVSRKR